MKTKTVLLIVVVFLALSTMACTFSGGTNPLRDVPKGENGPVAGFWDGLIHGAISPVLFVISLFDNHVNMYEVNNNGHWYDLGWVLGAGLLFKGGSSASSSSRSD